MSSSGKPASPFVSHSCSSLAEVQHPKASDEKPIRSTAWHCRAEVLHPPVHLQQKASAHGAVVLPMKLVSCSRWEILILTIKNPLELNHSPLSAQSRCPSRAHSRIAALLPTPLTSQFGRSFAKCYVFILFV